ncbi:MAG: adenylate/guanylate cyclase domain-containing protein [Rhodobacterales bacterium]|nr:adenylate/guanylate cyclase domain-containing protein [Rhodobacterales bacterium]
MGFEIFKKEEAALAAAKALLQAGTLEGAAAQEHFETLTKAYEKLFKTTKRLVRMSDRNEAELNRATKSLDEKNAMLEGLSKKLAKYLSPQVYDSIFTGAKDVALRTERKKLTVFFSDIKNFTQTTEDMQPEDLTYLLNDYFSEMSRIAIEHGATIDKFIGDAMLIFFGDPESRGVKEDARACVAMAIAMQRRMRDLQERWRSKGFTQPLQMRIGINTGYCNVGNFGSEDRMDYTIIGGEVNLAARLEGNADPDGILISAETQALVSDLVQTEEREAIQAKGIRKEVRAFAITSIMDGFENESRYVKMEEDGLYLLLDLEKMDEDKRKQTITHLLGVVQRLAT